MSEKSRNNVMWPIMWPRGRFWPLKFYIARPRGGTKKKLYGIDIGPFSVDWFDLWDNKYAHPEITWRWG